MIIDTQIEFSNAQTATSTALSTNVYDAFSVQAGAGTVITPNTRLDLGSGTGDLYLVVLATTAFSGGTSPTLTVTLESADDAAISVNNTVHFSSGAISLTATPQGTLVAVRVPPALYRRYIGVRYTVTGSPTTGAVNAFLTPTLQLNRIYKSAFTVQ